MIGIIIGVAVIIFVILIIMYNNLIQKKNAIDNAYFSMDVMLKKRYDLIPLLVETVKGYMTHEKEVLTQLTELRQQVAVENLNINDKVALDNKINSTLQNVFASFENYPQ